MTAREKFRLGQRVRLTEQGRTLYRHRDTTPTAGTVTGFGRQPHWVKIQRDRRKTATVFHMDFWTPDLDYLEFQHD